MGVFELGEKLLILNRYWGVSVVSIIHCIMRVKKRQRHKIFWAFKQLAHTLFRTPQADTFSQACVLVSSCNV